MFRSSEFQGMLQSGPDIMDAVLTALLDNSRDCIKLLDPEGRLLYVNQAGPLVRQTSGAEEILGRYWWELWPAEAEAAVREAHANAAAGKIWDFRGFCPIAQGAPKWWDVRVSPVTDVSGKVIRILVVSKDVTDAVTNRKMYETIALEMRHRLKNAFAISSAITKISARTAPEHQAFAEDLVNRFSSLAVAQAKLLDVAPDFPLRELISDLVSAAGVSADTIDVSRLPDCRLDESGMRIIAVVIGELTTNSLKYGALRAGHAVHCEGELEEGWLRFVWTEGVDDVDLDDAEQTSSTHTGVHVMRRIVLSAGGTMDRVIGNGRLVVSFSVPHRPPRD